MKLTIQSALSGEHDETLNAALCEWLGWERVSGKAWWRHPKREGLREGLAKFLPDHINGEAALWHCHQAEKRLDALDMDTRSKWLDSLAICIEWPTAKNAADLRFEIQYRCARATSRQRVVAMLLTVKPEMFSC